MEKLTKEDMAAARIRIVAIMARRVGPEKKIGMGELFEQVFQRPWNHRINDTRLLRDLITEMRFDGFAIMSDQHGYWNAASGSEIKTYCDKEKKRALFILEKISRIRNLTLPELMGQIRLELEVDDEKTAA